MNIELYTPFPPSVNNYYVKTQRGVFISQKGRKFRQDVQDAVFEQLGAMDTITTKLLVEVVLFPPDLRKRDMDNYSKSLLDAITHALVWEDDSQIDQLFVYRGAKKPKTESCAFVRIGPAGPIIPNAEFLP